MSIPLPQQITIVGLGYVGLPLAVAMARHFRVIGFDVDARRVAELTSGSDRTGEVAADGLAASGATFTSEAVTMAGTDLFIVAVPTPVGPGNKPDFSDLKSACAAVAPHLGKGAVAVFESTVYPGATEEICGPLLEEGSGLACGSDFFLGYSPERMNPGDPEHTLPNVVKVVAGQTPDVAAMLAEVYGKVTTVFVARDIATAEAAKVIENAQRDINIAFVNEVTQIFDLLGISVYDVLDAATTKWNFLNFRPGLVGGHCIGVDPYYLAERAQQVGYDPHVVLSGRRTNDGMAAWLARCVDARLPGSSRILVLGLTFKENVPDLRNSGAAELVRVLSDLGHSVAAHDPYADPAEARAQYGVELLTGLTGVHDCVVGAVAHRDYDGIGADEIARLLPEGGLLADIKGMWRDLGELPDITIWRP